jgi:hypothetical protein
LVTVELDLSVVLIRERAFADAFPQLPQVDDAENNLQCDKRHDRHDRNGAK